MPRTRDDYPDPSTRQYPHLGEPAGLTIRQSRDWRRANTYYIRRGEAILRAVLGDPMDCFTPTEWLGYAVLVPGEGYRLHNSPYLVNNETRDETLTRQGRSLRAAACDDCTLAHQLSERMAGRCHPSPYALTPVKRLMDAEGLPDDAATRDSTPNVLREKAIPEPEVR